MSSPLIELNQVGFRYDETWLLKDVGLQIYPGESLVIVGPSGQGKSTLLKIMAGLLEPTLGRVHILGQDLYKLGPKERHQLILKMGMLFQKKCPF